LYEILSCWHTYIDNEKYGYKEEEVRAIFEEADKEIPNISTSYEKDPTAIYTSRAFAFKNLSKPINLSFITTSYLSDEGNMIYIVYKIIKMITNFLYCNRLSRFSINWFGGS
jgi:hypothetical protein